MTPPKARIGRPPNTARNARVIELHDAGFSYTDIIFKLVDEGFDRISAARVGQIVTAAKS